MAKRARPRPYGPTARPIDRHAPSAQVARQHRQHHGGLSSPGRSAAAASARACPEAVALFQRGMEALQRHALRRRGRRLPDAARAISGTSGRCSIAPGSTSSSASASCGVSRAPDDDRGAPHRRHCRAEQRRRRRGRGAGRRASSPTNPITTWRSTCSRRSRRGGVPSKRRSTCLARAIAISPEAGAAGPPRCGLRRAARPRAFWQLTECADRRRRRGRVARQRRRPRRAIRSLPAVSRPRLAAIRRCSDLFTSSFWPPARARA